MEKESLPNGDVGLLLTGEDVAAVLRISRSLAYQLIRQRAIPSIKIGRLVRVRQVDLQNYIRINRSYRTFPLESHADIMHLEAGSASKAP